VKRDAFAFAIASAFASMLAAAGCERQHVAIGALEIDPSLSMETQLQVLPSRAIAQRVSRELGLAAELDLDGKVRARRRGQSQLVELEVRDDDLHRAVILCDAIMKVYLDRRVDQHGRVGARVAETCVSRP